MATLIEHHNAPYLAHLILFLFLSCCCYAFAKHISVGARWWYTVAEKRRLVIAIVTLAPIVLRFLLLPAFPRPKPLVADEFVHLLAAETFASGRLVNPPTPHEKHFEEFHVLQRPHYASSYPPGQGAMLALGKVLFGNEWFGVVIATGLMCGAICWMLYGCFSPSWALSGGVLCVFKFGIFSYWMNSYFGGSLTAFAGAMALGCLVRSEERPRAGLSFGACAGLTIMLLARPLEGLVFSCAMGTVVIVWLTVVGWRNFGRAVILRNVVFPVLTTALLTVAVQAVYNQRVTGHYASIGYQLSRESQGVPQTFFFQKAAAEPPDLPEDLRRIYHTQRRQHDYPEIFYRVKDTWKFFIGVSPTFLLVLLPLARGKQVLLFGGIAGAVVLSNLLYFCWFAHYFGPITGAIIGLIIVGAIRLWNWGYLRLRVRHALVIGAFASEILFNLNPRWLPFGTRMHLYVEHPRHAIESELTGMGGKHLIFVEFGSKPSTVQWIYNSANIEQAPVLFARSLDIRANATLTKHLADRKIWLVNTDNPANYATYKAVNEYEE